VTEQTGRRLRTDARVNQDRVLAAAVRAFARDGADTSLRAIARDAGVGIGTLYRRFPTREDLIWAVYRSEVDRIASTVPVLLDRHRPDEALRAWMESFLGFLVDKPGLADALKAALGTDEHQRLETRALLTEAIGTLLDAGVAGRCFRSGVAPLDVMMALGGISLIAGEPEQHEQAGRLLDLLMAGLRP
jgi:AcrR family transcriptional regulator